MEQGAAGVKLEEETIESHVLKDIIAYVDVFSSKDSRSKSVTQVLEQLGAAVKKKFTNDVTHVIYKEGTQKTLNKARETGVHLLSVLWVDSCKQNQEHVSEKLFPANLPDSSMPHLFLVNRKRPKCRRPQDFLDEPTGKHNKLQVHNRLVQKCKATDDSPSPSTLPRTPDFSACRSPIRLAVPQMTPGMKAKLERLQKAKLVSEGKEYVNSPVKGEVCETLQRQLFDKSDVSSDMNSSDPDDADSDEARGDNTESPGMLMLKPGHRTKFLPDTVVVKSKNMTRRLLSQKENSPLILNQEGGASPPEGYTCSPLFSQSSKGRNVSKRKGQKRKEIESGEESEGNSRAAKVPKPSNSVSSESSAPSRQPSITEYSRADVVRSGPCMRKCRRKSVPAGGSHELKRDSTEMREGGMARCRASVKGWRQGGGNVHVTPVGKHKTNSRPRVNDLCSYKDVLNDDPSETTPISHVQRGNTNTSDDKSAVSVIDSCKTEGNLQPIKSSVPSDCVVGCEVMAVPQKDSSGSVSGLSMSMTHQDSLLFSTFTGASLAPPRPSIDEFQLAKKRPKQRLTGSSQVTFTRGVGTNSRHAVEDSGNSSGSDSSKPSCKLVKSLLLDATGKQEGGNFHSVKSSDSSEGEKSQIGTRHFTNGRKVPKRSGQKPIKSIVMTSLHTSEQELMISVVKKLYSTKQGQFYIRDMVGEDTTHVVCGDGRRTLNVLYAIARGCWLLPYTWVLKSLEAGRWLDEENYECGEYFPAAKLSRQERQCSSGVYRKTFFSSVGKIFICKKTKPPREDLVSLVQLCGGQVTTCRRKASVVVGSEFHPDVISVSSQWVLDTITQFKLQAFDKYLTSGPKRQSSPEF